MAVMTFGLGHGNGVRGVCGNFRFKMFDISNVLTTISIYPNTAPVLMAVSVNTSDKADVFKTAKLQWTGTTSSDGGSGLLIDNTADAVFVSDSALNNGLSVVNTTDGEFAQHFSVKNTDELYVYGPDGITATDMIDASEAWQIDNDRYVQLISQTATDDGMLLVIGR